ncbi:erythromycin esterase family protein [Bacillus solitudinis]|uniref:erythromycin esterase family protein n=1 Tax=Bacillus solitudinis TaxID=2014074 RepID=UPI000C246F82|nr:erythromycin esterase family protein [Bacillus solitudinis]
MRKDELNNLIVEHSVRFESSRDLEPLLTEASNAKFLLLGEATHGTSEFYSTRAEMTKWLIKNRRIHFIAVEGDWPSCFEVNRYIKGQSLEEDAKKILKTFDRWPSWMWANEEMVEFITWLRSYNDTQDDEDKIGFYGMDVYSLWESMEAVIDYLDSIGSSITSDAKKAFNCFEPYHRDAQKYGVAAALYGEDCLEELMNLLKKLRDNELIEGGEETLNLKINSLVMDNAENYYRTMVTHDDNSWNIRDRHMVEVVNIISSYYGLSAKGVIWEHNTHVGDARATPMADEGLVNVGQLMRESYGDDQVYIVGFGTYEGTVIAADSWGDEMKVMQVPPAIENSWEDILHQAGAFNKFLMFTHKNKRLFQQIVGHRAIGVSYNPMYEQLGNYVPTNVPERYDAYIHIDQTQALTPLYRRKAKV